MPVDFERLKHDLIQAMTAAIASLREANGDEHFYAFALYTDDDARGILPAANSEEGLAATIASYRSKDPQENAFLRWSTSEWAHECFGSEHFDRTYAVLSEHLIENEEAFLANREKVFDLMIQTLAALDDEGVFGRGREREQITLLCSITDSDSARDLENRSIRELNPPSVVAAYEASLKVQTPSKAKKKKGTPCPKCGEPLRTPKAQQCFLCGTKWHGQPMPKF